MHGLLFGGFTSTDNSERIANLINEWHEGSNINPREMLGMSPENPYIESYRSFGNHRIATHLRKDGWDVECIDYGVFFTNDELKKILSERVTKETVFIGFSMIFLTPSIVRMKWLTDYIRKEYPWVKIISGGQKTWTVKCIDADYFITGNGEYAMDALLKYLCGRGPEPRVSGTIGDGKLIMAQHAYPCFPKRDASISFEDRDFLQPNETLNVEFSRGCIFSCKYCSFPLLGMKQDTTRDEDSLYEELLENYERWGITNYYVTDDTINDSKDKIALLARAVRRLPFKPQFSGYVRGDLLIRHGKETWDDMIDMGLTSHHYGVESFNYESGKSVGKGMKPEEMQSGLLEIRDYFKEKSHSYYCGIFSMIAGLPHETFESLDRGKEWINENWTDNHVNYFPLMLKKPSEHDDNIDVDVYNNFMEYGYTYSQEVPFIEDENMSAEMNRVNDVLSSVDTARNWWTHPSGDYDFIDMTVWVREFNQSRIKLGVPQLGPWQTNFVHAKTYKNPEENKEYYKSFGQDLPFIPMINIINQYKRNKLS